MKYFLKLGFVLLVITTIASGILALINNLTDPVIKSNQKKVQEEARRLVLPEAIKFVKDSLRIEKVFTNTNPLVRADDSESNMFYFFRGIDEAENLIGYTFEASLYGYSSEIKTMVGAKINEGKDKLSINKIKIISQAETPGLGANCMKKEFQDRFTGLPASGLVVDKDGGTIRSITGATISTRTIANSIKIGMENLLSLETHSTDREAAK